jgi:hypothetical protein
MSPTPPPPDPPGQDEWSIEISGQVGACVTPPANDGHS